METKIPKELQEKLEKWESNKPEYKTVRALEDIAAILTEVLESVDDSTPTDHIGAILMDIRESLGIIKGKDIPEFPDYAKPIVETLNKLDDSIAKSIDKIDMRPEFKPNITVTPTEVTIPEVDLRGIEDILRIEVPKAFAKAISLIPKTEFPEIPTADNSGVESLLAEMSEKLDSIDIGTRLKPQPGSMAISNLPAIGFAEDADKDTEIVTVGSVKTITITDGVKTKTITIDSTDPADKTITEVWS